MSIYEKAFAKSDKTDAILVVEGKKLHVNKALLSYHSDFFKSFFNSDSEMESTEDNSIEEFPMEDDELEIFSVLLSQIHENPLEITDSNAGDLLMWADIYSLRLPKIFVERFIISSGSFRRHEKMKLADRYELKNLLEHALTLYDKKEFLSEFTDDFQKLYKSVSPKLKNIVFDRLFEVEHKSSAIPKLTIYEQTFIKTDKTDAILLVEGKKMHVNKALLSYHSDYFKTLFHSDFKEKSMEEIPMEDVKFDAFAVLLSLAQDNPIEYKSNEVRKLLELADRFLLNIAKNTVERYIIHSDSFSRYEKLKLADEFELENLLEHSMNLYNTKESFKDFMFTWNRNFSSDLKAKLFDRFSASFAKSL